jgi:transmembrane sensor
MTADDSTPLKDDPIWQMALAWRRRLQAAPQDRRLRLEHAQWLKDDPRHADAFAQMDLVWQLTGALPPSQTATLADLKAAPSKQAVPRRRYSPLWVASMAVAAMVLLMVAVTQKSTLFADFHTQTAQRQAVTLQDGSVVHLDAQSAIALDFSPQQRGLNLLEGRAFFDITPDKSRPFVIAVGDVAVTVVGTSFDIQKLDESVTIDVRSGVVSVSAYGHQEHLLPGRGAVVDTQNRRIAVRTVEPTAVASWREGRLVVEDGKVGDVVEELSRYMPGKVLLLDPHLAEQHISGSYDLSNPKSALRAVVYPHGGKVEEWPYLTVIDR